MCLATPGRITAIAVGPSGERVAEVDFGSVRRSAQLLFLPEAQTGDFVIVQAGFAIRRATPEEAEDSLRAREELDRLPASRATAEAP